MRCFFGGFGGCVLLVCGFGFLLCCVWISAGRLLALLMIFGFLLLIVGWRLCAFLVVVVVFLAVCFSRLWFCFAVCWCCKLVGLVVVVSLVGFWWCLLVGFWLIWVGWCWFAIPHGLGVVVSCVLCVLYGGLRVDVV